MENPNNITIEVYNLNKEKLINGTCYEYSYVVDDDNKNIREYEVLYYKPDYDDDYDNYTIVSTDPINFIKEKMSFTVNLDTMYINVIESISSDKYTLVKIT